MKLIRLLMLIVIALVCSHKITAQEKVEHLFGKPLREVKTPSCERISQQLDILVQGINRNDLIIIISHLGKKENKSKLGLRRLHNAKTYFTDALDFFKRTPDSIVIAEGEPVIGKGHLDFYVKGELALRIYLNLNADLSVPPCVILPPDKPCSTPFEKLFYPCKEKER